ncbi:glycine receptor subunit alphaZ1-like [Lytechinus variegatus]|uniref:glycine receptor subunit alphaZ1-like n=1 Tax=Lytechinus variegatus TaxID=7654 RepID=UPI001BB0EEA3|nr:glycine receptor subunit alphaZ1-like [Lytechinus variegatus]
MKYGGVTYVFLFLVVVPLIEQCQAASKSNDDDVRELQNQTVTILNGILDGYDKRLRPGFGGPPITVRVSMYVYSMGPVTEAKMEYTMDLYFRQQWRDERLQFNADFGLALNAEILDSFWIPDIYIINEKSANYHTILYKNSLLRIEPNGDMLFSTRLTITASCNMDLSHFPFDKQRCSLDMESYAYSDNDVQFIWLENSPVYVDPAISLPQFKFLASSTRSRIAEYFVGNYTVVSADFFLGRDITYYVIQTYIPSSMITCLSWLSFWINRNAVPARVALGITTVLTMTTLVGNAGNSLPKLSYIKAIDLFLGMCYIFVFAALLEYVVVIYYDQPRYQKARQLMKEFLENGQTAKEDAAKTIDVAIDIEDEGNSRSRSEQNGRTSSRPPTSQDISRSMQADAKRKSGDDYGFIEGKVSKEEPDCMEETLCSYTQSFREKICVFGFNPYSVDRVSRIVFPLVFFTLNLIYWLVYLVFDNITVEDLKHTNTL